MAKVAKQLVLLGNWGRLRAKQKKINKAELFIKFICLLFISQTANLIFMFICAFLEWRSYGKIFKNDLLMFRLSVYIRI